MAENAYLLENKQCGFYICGFNHSILYHKAVLSRRMTSGEQSRPNMN